MKSTEAPKEGVVGTRLREHRLRNRRMELILSPAFGCHWLSLRLSVKGCWQELLVPVADEQDLVDRPMSCGSYLLAPWSNRIADARFEFDGESHALRANFPDGTAIHGDVHRRPWEVVQATEERFEAVLDSRTFDDFNYPFAVTFRHWLELTDESLRVGLCIRNVDDRRAPVGMGFHPFLRRRLTAADRDIILRVPAEDVYPAENCIPTAPPVPVSPPTDLRTLDFLENPDLDHCFTGLSEDILRIIYPGTGLEVRFRVDPVFGHVVVYAPTKPDGGAEDYVAVEPVTHANDGFNLHSRGWDRTGVTILQPGEELSGAWDLSAGDI